MTAQVGPADVRATASNGPSVGAHTGGRRQRSTLAVQVAAALVISSPAAAHAAAGKLSWLTVGLVLVLALSGVWLLSAAALAVLAVTDTPSGGGVAVGSASPTSQESQSDQRADDISGVGGSDGSTRRPLGRIEVARVPARDAVAGDPAALHHTDEPSAEPMGSLR